MPPQQSNEDDDKYGLEKAGGTSTAVLDQDYGLEPANKPALAAHTVSKAASQPGAFQKTKGGPILNVNTSPPEEGALSRSVRAFNESMGAPATLADIPSWGRKLTAPTTILGETAPQGSPLNIIPNIAKGAYDAMKDTSEYAEQFPKDSSAYWLNKAESIVPFAGPAISSAARRGAEDPKGLLHAIPELAGAGLGTGLALAGAHPEARAEMAAIPERVSIKVAQMRQPGRIANFDNVVRDLAGKTPADLEFTKTLDTVRPDIAKIARDSGFAEKGNARVGEFKEMLDSRANEIWDEEHKPQVQRHKAMPIDHASVADRARAAISKEDRANNPAAARAADRWIDSALNEDVIGTVGGADEMVRRINAEIPNLPEPFKNIGKSVRNAAAKGIRSQLETALATPEEAGGVGEGGLRNPNTRWGALRNVSEAIEGRLNNAANKPMGWWDTLRSARTPMVEGAIAGGGLGALGGREGAAIGGSVGAATGLVGSIAHDIIQEPGGRISRAMKGLGKTDLQPNTVQTPGWVGNQPAGLIPEFQGGATPMGNGPDTSGPVPESERVAPMVHSAEDIAKIARQTPETPPNAGPQIQLLAPGEFAQEVSAAHPIGPRGEGGTRFAPKGLLPAPPPAAPVGVLPPLGGSVTNPLWGIPAPGNLRPTWQLPEVELMGPWGPGTTKGGLIPPIEHTGVKPPITFERTDLPAETPKLDFEKPVEGYKPSEKATTMSAKAKDYGTEFNQAEWQEEIRRNKGILRNEKATPEERQIAQDRLRDAQEGLAKVNASGESSASLEAINRTNGEKARGEQRVRIDTRSGKEIPLIGVDAVDAVAGPHDVIVKRSANGETVLDSGAQANYKPKAAPAFKLETDNNGTHWAVDPNGVRVSIPEGATDAQIQKMLSDQGEMRKKFTAERAAEKEE